MRQRPACTNWAKPTNAKLKTTFFLKKKSKAKIKARRGHLLLDAPEAITHGKAPVGRIRPCGRAGKGKRPTCAVGHVPHRGRHRRRLRVSHRGRQRVAEKRIDVRGGGGRRGARASPFAAVAAHARCVHARLEEATLCGLWYLVDRSARVDYSITRWKGGFKGGGKKMAWPGVNA